jgi:putative alpha-1,2-mannosidase
LVIDFSMGGLAIPYGATVPLRAHIESLAPGIAQAEIVVEGAPLAVHLECDAGDWRQLLWYDRRLMPGGTRLDFDRIRPTTLRPFGLMWRGPAEPGQVLELRFGFSLRGVAQAQRNLHADCGSGTAAFESRKAKTATVWRQHLNKIKIETSSGSRQTIFATALYHSLIKPCFAPEESPTWPTEGPFVFDICTMWDIYRTQLPLITALYPARAVELANALLAICEEEGNLPIGYRMAKGADRFSRQGSALVHTFLADLCQLGMPGIDWDWALCHMDTDLRRGYGEDYLVRGIAEPITHTLDLAFGYHCTAKVARYLGDNQLAMQFEGLANRWINAFNRDDGLLIDSTYYEGGKWNYSFRLLHDMKARIDLAGGEAVFLELLDRFFGYGADPVKQLGELPNAADVLPGMH